AHAFPASTGRRLEQHGIAELLGDCATLRGVPDGIGRARDDGNAGIDCEPPGGGLAAHRRNSLWRRPDEHETGVAHGAREPLALREKTVAGMDRLGAGPLRRVDDAIAAEIA